MLSSGLTWWLKRLPALLFCADAGLAAWLALSHTLPSSHLAPGGLTPAQFAWLALTAPLLVLALAAWWTTSLQHVATDGRLLFVDDGRHCATVSLSAVNAVRGWRQVVTIVCDRDTPCGRKIRFLAPALARPRRGNAQLTVEVLQRMVRNAQRQGYHGQ
jgi:hypothetical protein